MDSAAYCTALAQRPGTPFVATLNALLSLFNTLQSLFNTLLSLCNTLPAETKHTRQAQTKLFIGSRQCNEWTNTALYHPKQAWCPPLVRAFRNELVLMCKSCEPSKGRQHNFLLKTQLIPAGSESRRHYEQQIPTLARPKGDRRRSCQKTVVRVRLNDLGVQNPKVGI